MCEKYLTGDLVKSKHRANVVKVYVGGRGSWVGGA